MPQVITRAGEQLFALKAQNNEQLDIDTFVFAYIPDQEPNAPIDRDETLPPIGQQVHQQVVQQYGRVNGNVVVYSTVLDSLTGPFEFNWVGLYSSVNETLVAISHVPTVQKTVTVPGEAGNTLNRNFGIEYSGIAELTGIIVEPETWQLDFTARLNGMDELRRQLAEDMNGKNWFIGNGFKVEPRPTVNTFKVIAGAGYISGLRVKLEDDHILALTGYPRFVYADAWFDGTSESVWTAQTDFTVSETELEDYIDGTGKQHYLLKIATITDAETVEDLRGIDGLKEKIENHIASANAHALSAISRAVREGMALNPVNAEEAMDWHGIFVEEFRRPDDIYDSDVINRALQYISNLPFTGTKLIFQPRRSYRPAHTCWLTNVHDCHIDLNGATIRRLNGADTSSTLAAELTVAGGTTFTLAAVPSNWRIGDAVTAFTDDTDLHTSQDPRVITDISGNNVTIAGQFAFKADSAGPGLTITTLPVGTRIAKAYSVFSSESALDTVNRRVFITNGKFDGNSGNQFNVSWRFIPELYLQGNGGLIQDCHFFNMTTETIVGHGFDVVHNLFEDIGGSCYHLSVHDDAIPLSGFGFFTRNTCKRTNLATNAKVGHSEGLITFSWGGGNLIVTNNNCEDGAEGFLGAFSSSVGAMADRLMIAQSNIVKRFAAIIAGVTPDVDGVSITGNVFDDCGDNDTGSLGPYWLNRRATCNFSGNALTGGTIAEQWSKADKLMIGNNLYTGAARLSPTIPAHIKQGTSGYNVALPGDVMAVLESDLNAFMAFLMPADKVAGLAFHVPTGNAAGSCLLAWDHAAKLMSLGSNEAGGKTTLRAGSYTRKLTAQDDGVQLDSMTDGGNQYFYLGNSTENGTWRFRMTDGNLEMQKNVAGTYVTKSTVSGD